jgi:multiple sugar transport system permease protein
VIRDPGGRRRVKALSLPAGRRAEEARARMARLAAGSRRTGGFYSRIRLAGFLFVLPGLLFFLLFFLYPILHAVRISFSHWDLFSPMTFTGLANYADLFSDSSAMESFRVTGVYALVFCLSMGLVPLVMALLLNARVRLGGFFQALYFVPSVLSLTVVSIVWQYLFRELGLLNMILKALCGVHPVPWLTSSRFALPSIVISMVWAAAGYSMIIFLAGLRSIPEELHEAAAIDGAGWWRSLRHVTFPLLKPTFLLVSVSSVIDSLQAFAPFFLMTSGGPGNSTRAITLKIYDDAFFRLNMGRASAASMILFVVMLAVSLLQIRLFRSEVSY